MVYLLRPEEVPHDLICSVCLSVPVDPCYTRECDHVFCPQCIGDCLQHQASCPVCRTATSPFDIVGLEEGSLVYRIWSTILIKCDNCEAGCGWTGSISDYHHHHQFCRHKSPPPVEYQRSDSDQDLIDTLQTENENLKRRLLAAESEADKQRSLALEWESKHNNLQVNYAAYKTNAKVVKAFLKEEREFAESNGRGGYSYDRTSVVKLTRLICQSLEDKPLEINANKIFECVRNIYLDLKRGYSDNPAHYYVDVRMLFGVCLASTWFTDNQRRNLNNLAREQGWL